MSSKCKFCNLDSICPNPLCQRVFKNNKALSQHLATSDCVFVTTELFKKRKQLIQKQCGRSLETKPIFVNQQTQQLTNQSIKLETNLQIIPEATLEPVVLASTPTNKHNEENDFLPTTQDEENDEVNNTNGFLFSKQDLFETQLLKILNDANTPHFLFQDLMEWASNASKNGYNFIPLCATRKATIKRLEKDYQLQYCRPFQIPITFQEDGLEIEITAFDFQAQLYSLLSNDELTNDLNMLDVNKDDPFTKYIPPDGMIGTFNSGSWYNNAWDFCVRPNTNDWMCLIIFGINETLVKSHLN